jgi:hypothetical protein
VWERNASIRAATAGRLVGIRSGREVDGPRRDRLVERELGATAGVDDVRDHGDPHPGGLGIFPDRRDEFRESLAEALDYAEAVGASMVHAMAGILPPEQRAQQH